MRDLAVDELEDVYGAGGGGKRKLRIGLDKGKVVQDFQVVSDDGPVPVRSRPTTF